MLQVKLWAFDLHKPNGYTPAKMQKEINKFMRENTCLEDTFEMYEIGTGIMFCKVLYKTRKTKT